MRRRSASTLSRLIVACVLGQVVRRMPRIYTEVAAISKLSFVACWPRRS